MVGVQLSLSKRLQQFGDASVMEQAPRTAAVMERSHPELRRQARHATELEKIMTGYQT